MKKSIGVIALCLCISCLFAQKISPAVLSNAGAVMKANNVSIEWTLGEFVTETLKNNNNNITQGFHQTNLIVVSTNNPFILGLDIYPNPFANDITVANQSGKVITFHLMNILGQCISDYSINPGSQTLPLHEIPSGTYLIEATTENQRQTFVIEKMK